MSPTLTTTKNASREHPPSCIHLVFPVIASSWLGNKRTGSSEEQREQAAASYRTFLRWSRELASMSDRATRIRRKSTRLSAVFSSPPPSPPARDVDAHHRAKTSSSSRIGVPMNASTSSSSSTGGVRTAASAGAAKRASNTSTGSTSTTAAGNNSSRRTIHSNNTTSADLIPTIRNRAKGRATAAKELVNSAPRFEDFLEDEQEDGADRAGEPSFVAAATSGATGRGRAKAQNGRAADAGKRKRGGDDEVDGLVGMGGKARAGSGRGRKCELIRHLFGMASTTAAC
jgi:hypothetical protein